MPLSEEELRLLEQMERALVEEDPKFASTLRGTSMRQSARRRAIFAGVCFTTGIAVLMAGAITELWAVGVVGFVIMLASAYVAITAIRGQQAAASGSSEQRPSSHPARGFTVIEGGRAARTRRPRRVSTGSFMERMEERWRRRREGNGGF
ncbi:DUF3040 domain-containing protein [Nocardioides sp.]|uniref:DUF3040 domain-containing protein n=1 Tax=Nocardioides sp. TaxID=35761 RepID=UPI0031FE4666|nr:hypothetical protein [Nocardioides sp.]